MSVAPEAGPEGILISELSLGANFSHSFLSLGANSHSFISGHSYFRLFQSQFPAEGLWFPVTNTIMTKWSRHSYGQYELARTREVK